MNKKCYGWVEAREAAQCPTGHSIPFMTGDPAAGDRSIKAAGKESCVFLCESTSLGMCLRVSFSPSPSLLSSSIEAVVRCSLFLCAIKIYFVKKGLGAAKLVIIDMCDAQSTSAQTGVSQGHAVPEKCPEKWDVEGKKYCTPKDAGCKKGANSAKGRDLTSV